MNDGEFFNQSSFSRTEGHRHDWSRSGTGQRESAGLGSSLVRITANWDGKNERLYMELRKDSEVDGMRRAETFHHGSNDVESGTDENLI
jgi:hypothetical protein